MLVGEMAARMTLQADSKVVPKTEFVQIDANNLHIA